MFFAFHGAGPYYCVFCQNLVWTWWDRDTGDGRDIEALVIHHLNEDHEDNHPENLAPSHYGCHTRHHKSLQPLVAKGSTLPERWRDRIAHGAAERMNSMTESEREQWRERVMNGMSQVDKTPTSCQCGAGPFKGHHGLGIHRARAHKEISCSS